MQIIKEVYKKHPAAVTIVCRDLAHAERLQEFFHAEYFRVYPNVADLHGVQVAGALKNVIAIGAGGFPTCPGLILKC